MDNISLATFELVIELLKHGNRINQAALEPVSSS